MASFSSISSLVESVASGMNPISGSSRSEGDIRRIVRNHLDKVAEDIGIRIVGFELHGSRLRGDSRPDSDLDVVFEYDDGDSSCEVETREDFVFNEMSRFPLSIDGIKVDFNPINASETGTLEDYMAKDREYDKAKSTDAEYLAAVKRGDMKECSRLVRGAAANAMPNTKVVDGDGLPLVVYHGTVGRDEELFTEIRKGMFSSNKDVAKYFDGTLTESPGRIYECMIDLRNPFVIDAEGASWNAIPIKKDVSDALGIGWSSSAGQTERKKGNLLNCVYVASDDIVNAIRLKGNHDGVILKNVVETDQENVYSPIDVVSFSPTAIKSADPVTYDDNGNVIPLSKRFDMRNPDIRW